MVPTSVHKCERKGFFINIFSDVWTKQSENANIAKGRKRYQVLKRYSIHAGIIIIYSLCICHSRNFLSSKQRSEN